MIKIERQGAYRAVTIGGGRGLQVSLSFWGDEAALGCVIRIPFEFRLHLLNFCLMIYWLNWTREEMVEMLRGQ